MQNSIEKGQNHSARPAHHRGKNAPAARAKPAAPTRPADVPQAASATIEPLLACSQRAPAATAPQAQATQILSSYE